MARCRMHRVGLDTISTLESPIYKYGSDNKEERERYPDVMISLG
jgi:hypothetical protein